MCAFECKNTAKLRSYSCEGWHSREFAMLPKNIYTSCVHSLARIMAAHSLLRYLALSILLSCRSCTRGTWRQGNVSSVQMANPTKGVARGGVGSVVMLLSNY